jgi:Zn finger protein HypA/HybF involved in hydrogenase expression
MTNQIEACPKCDSPSFEVNAQTNHVGRPGAAKKYRCKDCNSTFDDPVTRDRKASVKLKGLAKRLDEHDEQELGSAWQYRCPEGHASVEVWARRFYCRACEDTFDKSELRNLRAE